MGSTNTGISGGLLLAIRGPLALPVPLESPVLTGRYDDWATPSRFEHGISPLCCFAEGEICLGESDLEALLTMSLTGLSPLRGGARAPAVRLRELGGGVLPPVAACNSFLSFSSLRCCSSSLARGYAGAAVDKERGLPERCGAEALQSSSCAC